MKLKSLILYVIIPLVAVLNIFFLYTQSIRLDESQSLWVATKPLEALIRFVAEDVHVPLYFILLHVWTQIFGTHIIAARTLSLLFFVLTLPIMYTIAKESSTRSVGILTILLMILSPFMMWFTLEARMYTLLLFMTSLHHFFFLRMINTNGKDGKFELFLMTVLGFYTHYFFLFFLISQSFYVAYLFLKQRDRSMLWHYISTIGISFLFFIPWIWYVYQLGSASNSQPMIATPNSFNLFQTLLSFVFGFQQYNLQVLLVAFWPLLIVLFFFIFTQRKQIHIRNAEYFLIMTFVPLILAFVISYIRPIFLPRYLIFTIPTLLFIMAWLLLNAEKNKIPGVVATIATLMILFLVYQNSSMNTPVRENYEQVTQYLNTTIKPTDIIVLTAPFTVYPIEYNYTGPARITTLPEWNRYQEGPIPSFDQQKMIQQLKSYEGKYNRMVIVFSYDQGYEQQIKNHLNRTYHRLDQKQFASSIELRVYKMRY